MTLGEIETGRARRFERVWISLLAVFLALLVGAVVIVWAGRNPLLAYYALWDASFGSWRGFGEALVSITPLIFTGLSVAFAFRTGLFNIGAEGQLIMGQMGAAVAGYALTGLPAIVHVPLALLAGALVGAIWAGIPGLLKAKLGAHEVINTIMMNYIALYLTHYLVVGPLKGHSYLPVTKQVLDSAKLWRFIPPTRANTGFFVALLMAALVYFILWRTTLGYECRAVGLNSDAAEYAGINVSRNLVFSMMISGALAGMGGAVQVLGVQHRFYDLFGFTGYGFDGIAVALLGNNHPLGVIAGASLFGILARGSQNMQSMAQVPKEIIGIVQAAVVLFITADYLMRKLLYRRRRWGRQVPDRAGTAAGRDGR
ncbi:MAG: ABC transporter permease [Firmicutes bacterium]|nr:ABC transporter permease [Bacillota bacterium]